MNLITLGNYHQKFVSNSYPAVDALRHAGD